jgi:hypothetical protein
MDSSGSLRGCRRRSGVFDPVRAVRIATQRIEAQTEAVGSLIPGPLGAERQFMECGAIGDAWARGQESLVLSSRTARRSDQSTRTGRS